MRLHPDIAKEVVGGDIHAISMLVMDACPDPYRLSEVVGRVLAAKHDERLVIGDPDASYFGVHLEERTLIPVGQSILAPTSLEAWLARTSV